MLPDVSGGQALSPSRVVVGLAGCRGIACHRRQYVAGRRCVSRTGHQPQRTGHRVRRGVGAAHAGGCAPQHGLDHALHLRAVSGLCDGRPLAACAVDALWHGHAACRRPYVHDAGRHFRRRCRCVFVTDYSIHHLWRVLAVFGRGQVFYRFFVCRDGRQVHRRWAHHRARLLSAGRAVGQRRCDNRDAGHRGLSHAGEGGLWQGCGGRLVGRGRIGRHHFTAGAGRGGVSNCAVSQHLLSRCDSDGVDTDAALLLCVVFDGGVGCAQIRHAGCAFRADTNTVATDAPVLVSLHVVDWHRGLYGVWVFTRSVGVLGHHCRVSGELFACRLRLDPA